MHQLGLQARLTKRFKVTTDSQHTYPVAPNLLDRQFDVATPDKVWGADMIYLWTQKGWLYLAVVIDSFSRKVVGWSIDPRIKTTLVIKTLTIGGLAQAALSRAPSSFRLRHSICHPI